MLNEELAEYYRSEGFKQERKQVIKEHKKERRRQRELDRMLPRGQCSLCNINQSSSKHHLIPISNGHLGNNGKVPLCHQCHKFLHKAFDNFELANELNMVKKIKKDELVIDFLKLMKEHDGHLSIRRLKISRLEIKLEYGSVS